MGLDVDTFVVVGFVPDDASLFSEVRIRKGWDVYVAERGGDSDSDESDDSSSGGDDVTGEGGGGDEPPSKRRRRAAMSAQNKAIALSVALRKAGHEWAVFCYQPWKQGEERFVVYKKMGQRVSYEGTMPEGTIALATLAAMNMPTITKEAQDVGEFLDVDGTLELICDAQLLH
jgi:hypothetical protein